MRKLFACLLTLLIVLTCSLSFAEVGIKLNRITAGTATDLEFGNAYTPDGSTYQIGCSTSAEIATATTVIPLTYDIVPVTITGRTVTLAAGSRNGQEIKIVGVDRASGTLTITPAAAIGWSTATMAASGDTLDLIWLTSAYTGNASAWYVLGYWVTSVS